MRRSRNVSSFSARSARHQRRRRRQRLTVWVTMAALALVGVMVIASPWGFSGAGLSAITSTTNTVNSGPWPTSSWSAGSASYGDDSDGSVTLSAVGNANLAPYCVSANYTGTNPTAGWNDGFSSIDTNVWTNTDPTNATATGGVLRVKPLNTSPGLGRTANTNMTNSSVSVKVGVPGQNKGGATLRISVDNGSVYGSNNLVSMFYYDFGNALSMEQWSGGVRSNYDVTYNASTMAYWRILTRGQTVYFQYSGDGSSWTTGYTLISNLNLTAMKINLISEGVYVDSYATFDDVTLTTYTHSAFSAATSGALAANLNLTVEKGSGGGNGSCTGFTPSSTLYSGVMSGLPASFATGLDPTNNPPATTVYRISGTVPSLTTQRGSMTLTWHAQIGANTTSTWSTDRLSYGDSTPGTVTLNSVGSGNIGAYCLPTTYTGTLPNSGWSDAFTTTLDTTQWVDASSGNASITGSALKINAVAGVYRNIYTKNPFNFLDSTVSVKVTSVPGTTGEAWLQLRKNNGTPGGDLNNRLALWYYSPGNQLWMSDTTNGTETGNSLTYNSTTMKYWRITSTGTTVLWQYSSDGITWTTGRTKTITWDLSNVYSSLEVGTGGSVSNPKYATFDDFTYFKGPQARFYATTTGALANDVNLTIERGTGGASGSCTGFTPTSTVYTGTLAALPTTYTAGLDPLNLSATPQTTTYRITGTITPTSTKRSTTTITWQAQGP